jgi:phage shock protein A
MGDESGPTDADQVTMELKARVERERTAGAYADDLSDMELDKPSLALGSGLGAPGPRVQFRPELGFSSKPVVGSAITQFKRFLLRLQLYVFDDLARQADTAIMRLENALAVEIETRKRLEGEVERLERRTAELEARIEGEGPSRP